ncbi:ATP-dependent DNA helicase DinG [Bacillus spongiae]|uniref:3'-5' exonuclease DinG n=1 Tax=Bacillus spongiae TaxID=2683610 RepID=A0ABU8HCY7_9BACI
MNLQRMVVMDLETTGNAPKKGDKIIQLSAVIIENGKIVDQFTSFLNPQQPIPVFIEELTGINHSIVKGAPLFKDIAPKIEKLVEGAIFVAHNVQFDLTFLQSELMESEVNPFSGPTIDTVELAKIILPTADSYKLSDLSEQFSFQHDRPHQADSDAMVTAELLLMFMDKIQKLPLMTLKKLSELAKDLRSDLDLLFDYFVQQKEKYVEELPVSLESYRGLVIGKNEQSSKVEAKECIHYPYTEKKKLQTLKQMDTFEKRTSQLEMMDNIYDSFKNGQHCMIEAGTGIGKSIAYLLPAAYHSYQSNKTVVVSTHTIQLQGQLLEKEIPTLKKLLPFSIMVSLLKGKSHYLNLYKFEQLLKEEDKQYDTVMTKMQILVWLLDTEAGDVDELNLSSGGKLFWNRLKHDGDLISNHKNPWIEWDFYTRAKRQASAANIVITNHSMLLTDVKTGGTTLPEYDYLIIDEAHHLEGVARRYLGRSLDFLSARFLMGQLGTLEQKQLFYKLDQLIHRHALSIPYHPFEVDSLIGNSFEELYEFFQLLGEVLRPMKMTHASHKKKISFHNSSGQKWKKPLLYSAERVYSSVREVEESLRKVVEHVMKYYPTLTHREKVFLQECHLFIKEWEELSTSLNQMILQEEEEEVVWLEGDIRSIPNSLELTTQPISVGKLLEELLYKRKQSIILTSATLTVEGSFSYFQDAIGLKNNVTSFQFLSPFAFKEKSKLLVPTDIPDIQSVSLEEYSEAIASHLIPIAEATKGRMLILFTSYEMLKMTYDLMKESGLLEDYILMAQGITGGSRQRLTKNFQRFEKAILFGTNSFWEGVDIPGDDLSCLVLVRLPFSSPEEPINKVKSQKLQQLGKNPFYSYSLPEAVIRFKQGVGRLLRRSSDRGVIIVFDRRIHTTRYGNAFLKSIPDIPVRQEPLEGMIDVIENWL